uniref:Uncharacterized protein LOC111106639 n=1 Tax=Crassostrea virginica TaxID=6565 RepID=A0A8B8B1A4_CRAVI|nr:uncharacterized protein LOC111106639 [Crassostrea virginica]XP_022297092.1 uncharacterized protein LOC111106639 [Crassostrea virginica]XP_022297093.1 uncharacterized protein LOC111106639 [Crassostrea virginica]XP_022297094.1 uncharacterized protein LOC111106639 [Crassostrea virginica]XP_022297095.1 uncharacterized protein LOC111106639 [Crassostrea virginica]XP_022297096.1 uncharacterized protein LOC111106639 [Crassostrea virginica]XP_022297098.1 uncharacterized protein LOC111106639 [Crasso
MEKSFEPVKSCPNIENVDEEITVKPGEGHSEKVDEEDEEEEEEQEDQLNTESDLCETEDDMDVDTQILEGKVKKMQEVPKIPRKENTREFPGQMQKKSHKFRVGSLH